MDESEHLPPPTGKGDLPLSGWSYTDADFGAPPELPSVLTGGVFDSLAPELLTLAEQNPAAASPWGLDRDEPPALAVFADTAQSAGGGSAPSAVTPTARPPARRFHVPAIPAPVSGGGSMLEPPADLDPPPLAGLPIAEAAAESPPAAREEPATLAEKSAARVKVTNEDINNAAGIKPNDPVGDARRRAFEAEFNPKYVPGPPAGWWFPPLQSVGEAERRQKIIAAGGVPAQLGPWFFKPAAAAKPVKQPPAPRKLAVPRGSKADGVGKVGGVRGGVAKPKRAAAGKGGQGTRAAAAVAAVAEPAAAAAAAARAAEPAEHPAAGRGRWGTRATATAAATVAAAVGAPEPASGAKGKRKVLDPAAATPAAAKPTKGAKGKGKEKRKAEVLSLAEASPRAKAPRQELGVDPIEENFDFLGGMEAELCVSEGIDLALVGLLPEGYDPYSEDLF